MILKRVIDTKFKITPLHEDSTKSNKSKLPKKKLEIEMIIGNYQSDQTFACLDHIITKETIEKRGQGI